jgi:hypothetical protein
VARHTRCLAMRFADNLRPVSAPAVAWPATRRGRIATRAPSPVEPWAITQLEHGDATKIDDFWDASPDAWQHRWQS